MGTYMIGNGELIEAVDDALNKLEGDISNAQLQMALEVLRLYPYVCDKKKSGNRYTKAKSLFCKGQWGLIRVRKSVIKNKEDKNGKE